MRQSERGVLVGIVAAVAAVLRIAFASSAQVLAGPGSDSGQYQQYARNLLEHGVFSLSTSVPPPPDSFRSPGYPLFLAACRWFGGDAHGAAVAIGAQVVLGVLTVLMTYRLARALVGFWPAIVAASLVALSPHQIVGCTFLLTECLGGAALLAGCWALAGDAGPRRRIAAGLAFAVALLTIEALLPVVLLLFVVALRRGGRSACTWFVVAMLPWAVWQVRNRSTPMELHGGQRAIASISHGSYPGMVYGGDARTFGFPYRADPEQPAFGASWSQLLKVGGARFAEDPVRHLAWHLLEKPVWLWSWPLVQGDDVLVYAVRENPFERHAAMACVHAGMRWLHSPCMVLAALFAAVALLRLRRDPGDRAGLCAVVLLGTTLAYLPVIPDPRYLQPVRPLAFVFVAIGLAAIARRCGVPREAVALA